MSEKNRCFEAFDLRLKTWNLKRGEKRSGVVKKGVRER